MLLCDRRQARPLSGGTGRRLAQARTRRTTYVAPTCGTRSAKRTQPANLLMIHDGADGALLRNNRSSATTIEPRPPSHPELVAFQCASPTSATWSPPQGTTPRSGFDVAEPDQARPPSPLTPCRRQRRRSVPSRVFRKMPGDGAPRIGARDCGVEHPPQDRTRSFIVPFARHFAAPLALSARIAPSRRRSPFA